MASLGSPDPFEVWRQALAKFETGVNQFANKTMGTTEFAQALQQSTRAMIGLQGMFDKALDAYFKAMNLPSRKDVLDLAERLQRLEDKIDEMRPMPEVPTGPRLARTRKPQFAVADSTAEAAVEAEPVTALAVAGKGGRPNGKPSQRSHKGRTDRK